MSSKVHARSIRLFITMLEQWTNTVVPTATNGTARSYEITLALNAIWDTLADVLSGANQDSRKAFARELGQLRHTAEAGNPPVRTLERRLTEIAACGLWENFLVASVHDAVGELIATGFVQGLAEWQRLSEIYPLARLRFGYWNDEAPNQFGLITGYGSEDTEPNQ